MSAPHSEALAAANKVGSAHANDPQLMAQSRESSPQLLLGAAELTR
jgi:hypothetical protein